MGYRTWDPWRELEALRRDFDRVVSQTFGNSGRSPLSRVNFLPGRGARSYPLVNIRDDRENLYLEALAPGLNPDSLEITVVNDTLRLEGEKQAISADIKPESWHRSERSAGRFIRTLTLPAEVNSEGVTAEYRNGLLRITLPKTERSRPKQIAIQVQ